MDLCREYVFGAFRVCTYKMLCSALFILLTLMLLIYLLRIRYNPPARYTSGYLPFVYAVCCFLNLLVISAPYFSILYEHTLLTTETVVFAFCHTIFWFTILISRISLRNSYEFSLPVLLSEAFALLSTITPLFFWNAWIVGRYIDIDLLLLICATNLVFFFW